MATERDEVQEAWDRLRSEAAHFLATAEVLFPPGHLADDGTPCGTNHVEHAWAAFHDAAAAIGFVEHTLFVCVAPEAPTSTLAKKN